MFKFRLQRILELKEKHEQAVASRLADARSQEEALRLQCTALQEVRDEGVQRAQRVQGSQPTVGQLQNLRYVVDRLNEQIDQAQQAASQAEQTVQSRMAELAAAFKERRALDMLRDRDRGEWLAAEKQADRQLMDGIALNGFLQSRAAENADKDE